jgi:hypothetical protein
VNGAQLNVELANYNAFHSSWSSFTLLLSWPFSLALAFRRFGQDERTSSNAFAIAHPTCQTITTESRWKIQETTRVREIGGPTALLADGLHQIRPV